MKTFSGSSTLVIGGSRGIGRETVLALSKEGAKVWAVARDAARLETLRNEAASGRIETRAFDATDTAALGRLLDEADPELVVLSAGVTPRVVPVSGVGEYFSRYAELRDLRLVPGTLDGRPVLAMFTPRDAPHPRYFVFVEWRDDAVTLIRDFRHVPYIADEVALDRATFVADS